MMWLMPIGIVVVMLIALFAVTVLLGPEMCPQCGHRSDLHNRRLGCLYREPRDDDDDPYDDEDLDEYCGCDARKVLQ